MGDIKGLEGIAPQRPADSPGKVKWDASQGTYRKPDTIRNQAAHEIFYPPKGGTESKQTTA
jgi:hypothetical protein